MFGFRVWSCDRLKKASIIIGESNNMIQDVINKSNNKLEINGTLLVLEKDGTPIDEDLALNYYGKEILILLEEGESWIDKNLSNSDVEKRADIPLREDTNKSHELNHVPLLPSPSSQNNLHRNNVHESSPKSPGLPEIGKYNAEIF